jgi:hypothetical protein
MKIIITENQKYVLRRLQQFIDIVEDRIFEYGREDNPWWCSAFYTPDIFFNSFSSNSIEDFINQNWEFFHDDSEMGGSDMDISILDDIIENNYGNHLRNLWVSRCQTKR